MGSDSGLYKYSGPIRTMQNSRNYRRRMRRLNKRKNKNGPFEGNVV